MQLKGIEINGQKIAYYESGGRGPSVLFIHGNSQSGQSFRKQLDSPLGERYRLVALDLPGHGRSEPASDPRSMYTLPGCASLIASFVEKLDLKSALIVGWSLGGNILLEATARLTEARGLMIIGTVPARFPVPFVEAFLLSPNVVPIMFKRDISKEDIDLWMNHLFAPNILDLPVSFREDLLATDGSAREVFGDSAGEGNFKDELEAISSLRIPLAVIHGGKEQVVNLSYLKSVSMPTLWRGNIQIIPGAGHTPQWEQPSLFNKLLKEFIEDCNH